MYREGRNGATLGPPGGLRSGPNIALVKYWGVRDTDLVLPNNSSLSVTLGKFRTHTTVEFDPALEGDEFFLGGSRASGAPAEDVTRFLDRVRADRNERIRPRQISE